MSGRAPDPGRRPTESGRPSDGTTSRAVARRVVQQFTRTVLPAIAFDDPDLFFDLAVARDDHALASMLLRIDPHVAVPGLARFLGRYALCGGTWRHLSSEDAAVPPEWEATGISLPMVLDGDGRYAVVARSESTVRYFATLPAAEGTGLVVAERYGDLPLRRIPGADRRPTSLRTRSHRSLLRTGFLAFLDVVAEVLANSPTPPAASAPDDRPPRAARRGPDRFAHLVLRDLAFDGAALVRGLATPTANDDLAKVWASVCGRHAGDAPVVHGRYVADALGLWPAEPGDAEPAGAWDVAIVAMPGPVAPGEAYGVAIARQDGRVRYVTGDRTWDAPGGAPRAVLVEWPGPAFALPKPRVVEPWAPPYTIDAFAEVVHARLSATP